MTRLCETLSTYWTTIQTSLFPWLEEELGPMTDKLRRFVTILDVIKLEAHIPKPYWRRGRPTKDRVALARAFIAKAALDMPTTRALLDRLELDPQLRRICGWEQRRDIPSEAVFSRAFAEFAAMRLPECVHEELIQSAQQDRLVGHLSRDATAIEAREKPTKKEGLPKEAKPKRKRGRPKKGEEPIKVPTRLERQRTMTLEEMLDDLPKACDVGTKRNSKGYKETWIGYKLHFDVADGDIPISAILSSASMHDSQAAIPLAMLSAQRVVNLYDLMDSAYDATEIKDCSRALGHVPIIDVNPRRNKALKEELQAEARRRKLLSFPYPEDLRYNERSAAERVNGRLKDEFGGRYVRVRGHAKVMCHLMFGVVVLTADQLMRLIT